MKTLSSVAVTLTAGLNPVYASCDFDRDWFRSAHVESVSPDIPPGVQLFDFGPLQGRPPLRMAIEYLPTGEGSQITATEGGYCIQIDRFEAARTSLAIDAAEECQRIGRCDLLPRYLDRLRQARTAEEFALFEDVFPKLAPAFNDWCLGPAQASSWINRFQQFILAIQQHEIAHGVLNHPQSSASFAEHIDNEAEADGFASAVATIADLPLNAAGYFFGTFVEAERQFELWHAHPASACRIEALHLGLSRWYDQQPTVERPGSLPNPDRLLEDHNLMRLLLPNEREQCDQYAAYFDRGVRTALGLVTPQTTFSLLREEEGTCQSVADPR